VHSRDQPGLSAMGIDRSITTELGTPVNLDDRLRQSLPSSCMWFGEGDLELVGTHPIDAGGFADVWEGEMGGRRVAVKSYRCYLSGNCAPTFEVSHPWPLLVESRTDNRPTEMLSRGVRLC